MQTQQRYPVPFLYEEWIKVNDMDSDQTWKSNYVEYLTDFYSSYSADGSTMSILPDPEKRTREDLILFMTMLQKLTLIALDEINDGAYKTN